MAMNSPHTYQKYCIPAGFVVAEILPEIKDKIAFGPKEHVLDVGCGPGINTVKNLLPYLPKGSTIVASDLSEEMIDFAKEHCACSEITFKTLDITDKQIWSNWRKDEFSKLFSFYTVHRIQDQRKAYENMYNLLKPDGDLITVTPCENSMEKILPYLAKIPKYAQYSEKILKMRVHIVGSKDYRSITSDLLENIGLEVKLCDYTDKTYCAPSIDYLIEFYGEVSYLSNILPNDLFQEALKDAKKVITENNLVEQTAKGFLLKYTVLVTVARKKKIK